MYLVDTNVISEVRKKSKANPGVRAFFKQAIADEARLFISVVTVGELRRGVEAIRHRGDVRQANQLEKRHDSRGDGLHIKGARPISWRSGW